jgi:hypothetical protein
MPLLYHNATLATVIPHLCLSCGTSLEQIAPESLTLPLLGFVHRQM